MSISRATKEQVERELRAGLREIGDYEVNVILGRKPVRIAVGIQRRSTGDFGTKGGIPSGQQAKIAEVVGRVAEDSGLLSRRGRYAKRPVMQDAFEHQEAARNDEKLGYPSPPDDLIERQVSGVDFEGPRAFNAGASESLQEKKMIFYTLEVPNED